MSSRQDIIQAIEQGTQDVETTFSGLSEDQLATQVHADEGGWTAREILAHLAGRGKTHDLMFQRAAGRSQGNPGSFDVNAWNQQFVDERADKSKDELLAEFRDVHERLIQRVKDAPDDMLETTVQSARGEVKFADMLKASGGTHSSNHAREVDEAITQTP